MSLSVNAPLPAFDGVAQWFNGEPAPPAKTAAILVHFWAMSCPACKFNLPDLQRVQAAYRDRGLYVVAVHSPRMEPDNDTEAIAHAVAELGISEPCAVDAAGVLADRFEMSGLFPHYYLFDSDRALRRRGAGGNGFALVERVIERFLSP